MDKYEWIRCPACHHKLFKLFDGKKQMDLEIKCSSCKAIFRIKEGITITNELKSKFGANTGLSEAHNKEVR